jgi:2-polyprenyl-3-methyl-5-hydroxy-6-metoxy-1,4-benzoquinol methylase
METISDKLIRLAKLTDPVVGQELMEIANHLSGEDVLKLVNSEDWPKSVESQLICDGTENDKFVRATSILEFLVSRSLDGKRFLDFGCGEGHTAIKAMEFGATTSVGFDTTKQGALDLESESGVFLTTKYEEVIKRGPYDIILIYDVLDHIKGENAESLLAKAKSLLSQDGVVYLRCHPFCGRHGGHTYKQLNKAFAHLILTKEELERIGVTVNQDDVTKNVLYPIKTYTECIAAAGLNVISRNIVRTPVEDFFREEPVVCSRVLKIFKVSEFPTFQMEQDYVDYELGR